MPTCAFVPCGDVDECALVGGCVNERFPHTAHGATAASRDPLLPKSEAFNDVRTRATRDPTWTPRKRKGLTR